MSPLFMTHIRNLGCQLSKDCISRVTLLSWQEEGILKLSHLLSEEKAYFWQKIWRIWVEATVSCFFKAL